MPDLNLTNDAVTGEMHDIERFWLWSRSMPW